MPSSTPPPSGERWPVAPTPSFKDWTPPDAESDAEPPAPPRPDDADGQAAHDGVSGDSARDRTRPAGQA